MKTLTLFNTPVRINDDGMVCLTDMWRIAKARVEAGDNDFLGGRDIENLRPSKFKRLESTQLFIKELSKWDSKAHLETIQGKHGGTFGSDLLLMSLLVILIRHSKLVCIPFLINISLVN
ncbi:KilA-N domain-containing protein [Xenorhabdus griffiniae]|uniref:KilA-N domain-containing protein n=1 Tax=Xenorhabdus griffiniae TaxID=351672 RepID=UPI0023594507|nr:KilA-N domain-containing protein [Xenorhabdus griffiniae]MDC9605592.1 KilA-N domain-containing protein [Xenorhabdus griffiniae]